MNTGFFEAVADCLALSEPVAKCTRVAALGDALDKGLAGAGRRFPGQADWRTGAPAQPELVAAHKVPRRRLGSEAGRAALVHAIAHIEFNAINLALDAAYRFRGMPQQYYRDWISVAVDEARHFGLLQDRLHDTGQQLR